MLDAEKTKEQLIHELETVRRRLAGFQARETSVRQARETSDAAPGVRAELPPDSSEYLALGVLNTLSTTIAIVDERGFIEMVNSVWRTFAEDNGCDPDKVSEGVNYITVCETAAGENSEEGPLMAKGIRAVLAGETPHFSLEYPCHTPEQQRWFCTRVTRLSRDGVVRAVVAHEDITERKLADEATRENERKLRFLIENAPLGIFRSTMDGRLIEVNATHARMHGCDSPQELLEHAAQGTQVLYADPSRHAELRQTLKANGVLNNFESQRRRKDGSMTWASTNARLTTDPVSQEQIIEGFVMDISDRKRSEQFREDVERIIRHNIKAPLVSLHALAHYALADELDKEFRDSAPGVIHAIRQVINLVDSSEKILQMEKGEYSPLAGWFDLRTTLANAGLSLNAWTRTRRVTLVQKGILNPCTHPDAPLVWGEEFLVEDMLLNLIKNAVEASPEDSEVTISCATTQGEQRIDIHNFGMVPTEMQSRFFEKYATSGKSHGKGLGTYSAQLIAKAHGGRIEFTTSYEQGTTVTIFLPLPPAQ